MLDQLRKDLIEKLLSEVLAAKCPESPPYYDDDPCYPPEDPYQKGYEEGIQAKEDAIRELAAKGTWK